MRVGELLGVEVRAAEAEHAVACRGLLPEAFPAVGRVPELLVAVVDGQVAGAAAVAWVAGGFPVLTRVATGFRRRGIGRALMAAAVASAMGETGAAETGARETGAMRSWGTVEEGGAEAALLARCGFLPARRFLWFETDAAAFEVAMTGLLRRMRGRVPQDAVVTTLEAVPRERVVRLVAAGFSALPHDVATRLIPGTRNGYDSASSLVVVLEGEAVGAMLCRTEEAGAVLVVEARVVAPEMRGGWVNLVLVEAVVRLGRAAGARRFRFGCEPHVRDTIALARRCGAVALADRVEMRLEAAGFAAGAGRIAISSPAATTEA